MKDISEQKIQQVKSRFTFLGSITYRSQFGGYALLVDGIMFALVSDGELYLRANDQIENIFQTRKMSNLVYAKRGMPILLRYYFVDSTLWEDQNLLFYFVQLAYESSKTEMLNKKSQPVRLKDLPNLSITIEKLLWKVGIKSAEELKIKGAKCTYLKLKSLNKSLGFNVLLALAGAISGYHCAVLPSVLRNELLEWYEEIKNPEKG